MNSIILKGRAKINLSLDVVGKRENGYHDLEMIMQSINLYDTIYIRKTKVPGVRLKSNYSWLPTNEKNIAAPIPVAVAARPPVNIPIIPELVT